jgi:Na+(H+)/acetate symporter ActP
MKRMIGSTSPINLQLRGQITSLQAQLDSALTLYTTQRSSASLVSALKIQGQIVSALLNAAALATPTSTAQALKISALS